MISFFITEYVKKYPQLKGKKYLNANEIFKIDNNLFQKSLKYHDEERKKSISEYEMERKNIEMEIESKYLYTTEEIEEYIYELKEYLEENFIILETKIEMGIIKNNQVWLKSRYGVDSTTRSYTIF
jgi:phosphoribosylaminoimidazole-succinocarboxamide synthase